MFDRLQNISIGHIVQATKEASPGFVQITDLDKTEDPRSGSIGAETGNDETVRVVIMPAFLIKISW